MMFPRMVKNSRDRITFITQSANVLRKFLYDEGFMPHPPNLNFSWEITGHHIKISGAELAESISLVGSRNNRVSGLSSLENIALALEEGDLELDFDTGSAIVLLSLLDRTVLNPKNEAAFEMFVDKWQRLYPE